MLGYNIGTFQKVEVAFYISECVSRNTSGYIEPTPINPKPALLSNAEFISTVPNHSSLIIDV
jgi:hypothetical protein